MKRWAICVVCFVLPLLAGDTLDHAWQLAGSGRQTEAIQVLRSLVRTEPSNADVRLLLGSLLMEADQRAESIENLSVACKLRPSSFEASNALGEAYSHFGDTEHARAAFEKAVALSPGYGIAQLNLGQTLVASGDTTGAAKHLDLACTLLTGSDEAADAHYLKAKLDSANGETEQAAAHLEKAVSIRPKFAEAWADLGQCRKAMQDDAGAIAAFVRAVECNPQDAVAQYRMGAEYLAQDKPREAVDALQKSLALNPTDQSTLNALQKALRQDGRTEEAARMKAQLAQLLRDKDTVNQNHLTAIRLNNEAAAIEKAGDLRGALAKYAEAAQLYPDHAGIAFNYGVALLRSGSWTAGLNELHAARQIDPHNSTIEATLTDALAQAPAGSVPKWSESSR